MATEPTTTIPTTTEPIVCVDDFENEGTCNPPDPDPCHPSEGVITEINGPATVNPACLPERGVQVPTTPTAETCTLIGGENITEWQVDTEMPYAGTTYWHLVPCEPIAEVATADPPPHSDTLPATGIDSAVLVFAGLLAVLSGEILRRISISR